MITTTIVFDHRGRTEPRKEGPLEVRLTIGRKPYYVSTGVKVRRSEYRAGTIVNRPDAKVLNERVRVISNKIEEIVNEDIEAGRMPDVADIRRRAWLLNVDSSSTSLLDWLTEQADRLTLKEGTVKHYQTLLARLREFDGMRRWSDLTVENIYRFDAWLHQLDKPQSDADRKAGKPMEKISDGAVYNYHKCLKALLNRAVLFDRLPVNPYTRLRGQFKRGGHERVDYLTDGEIAAFMSLRPVEGSKMRVARDLFVVQMFTGLAYSDMQRFDIGQYKLIDGRWVNMGERLKTGVAYVSQLLPPVVEVLEKYNWKMPKINNSDYNCCLKALGMACGIERPLHSHMARHTFATYMLRQGIAIEHVSKMLGHTNITQTQRYARLVAADIHGDFEKIAVQLDQGQFPNLNK